MPIGVLGSRNENADWQIRYSQMPNCTMPNYRPGGHELARVRASERQCVACVCPRLFLPCVCLRRARGRGLCQVSQQTHGRDNNTA